MRRDDMPLLALDNVSKDFPGVTAIDNVSFTLETGHVVGLVGPNGSGKSTLLKLAAGLLRPTSGRVMVQGRTPGRETKTLTAYMSEVDPLYPFFTVDETIGFVRTFFSDWDDEVCQRLLDLLNLPRDQRAGDLSKGMATRLRLLLAMSRRAPLVLLDEPLAGIDPPSRSRIVRALLDTFRPGEQSLFLSTHEILETETLFDQILVLSDGRIKLSGAADELRSKHQGSLRQLLENVLD